ncbi:MAG TPA: porin [Geobacteraceae bacterium]|nr:porin [Geobacteraceae bacterium]
MKRKIVVSTGVLAILLCQNAGAKSLEEVLKEKGVITEADYKEISKSKPLSYKPGKGFTFATDDEKFQLTLGGRIQARYTYTDLDVETSKSPDTSKWEVRRMKFWLNGNAYSKDLTYLFQADFTQGGSSKLLEHAYFNYRLLDEFQILAGQTKVPFGRQWLNSSGSQQFVDRSVVSDTFRPGYDTGVKLSGDIMKGLATYELGVYGGAGQSTTRSSDENAFAARVTVNPFGKMAYAESDLDNSPKPLLSVGGNYYNNTLQKTAAGTFETNNITLAGSSGWLGKGVTTFNSSEKVDVDTFGADAAFKWLGASAQAEYLLGQADGHTTDRTLRAHGFYAQAGYCIIPKTLEAAFRYGYVDPNRSKGNDLIRETGGAVSWYFDKHNLKLQGDITNIHDQSKGRTDDLIYRLQAQLTF